MKFSVDLSIRLCSTPVNKTTIFWSDVIFLYTFHSTTAQSFIYCLLAIKVIVDIILFEIHPQPYWPATAIGNNCICAATVRQRTAHTQPGTLILLVLHSPFGWNSTETNEERERGNERPARQRGDTDRLPFADKEVTKKQQNPIQFSLLNELCLDCRFDVPYFPQININMWEFLRTHYPAHCWYAQLPPWCGTRREAFNNNARTHTHAAVGLISGRSTPVINPAKRL